MSAYEACLLSRPSRYTSRLLLLLLAPLGVCGCTTSLHRVYDKETDTVFEPGLLGAWQTEGATWIFDQGDGAGYELTMIQHGADHQKEPLRGLADLVAIGGGSFLFLSGSHESESADPYSLVFFRVELTSQELRLYSFNPFLFDFFEKHPHVLAHERRNGSLSTEQAPRDRNGKQDESRSLPDAPAFGWVDITASTEELQQFIAEHADDPEIFLGPTVFRRAPESVKPTDQ